MASVSGQVAGIDAVTAAKSNLQNWIGTNANTANLDANGKIFVNNTGDTASEVAKARANSQNVLTAAQQLVARQSALGIGLTGLDTSTTDAQASFLSAYRSYLLGAQNSGGKSSTIFSGLSGGGLFS